MLPKTGKCIRDSDAMRGLIEDELRFSASIVLAREEAVPRFRIEVPGEKGYMLFVPLPDDAGERTRRLELVAAFMAWKGANAFVMSSELQVPDALISVAVTRDEALGAARMVLRKPLTIGRVEWLSRSQIGDEIPAMLPSRQAIVSDRMMTELARVFGPQGEFKVERAQ